MKTLKDLKVGDIAYDVVRGEVTVVNIVNSDVYLIKVKDKQKYEYSYTFEGKSFEHNENPSLYLSNPFEQKGKWMMVSDDNKYWTKRFVFAEKNGKFIAWICAETDEEVLEAVSAKNWNYAKEIKEVPEYTMEELVAKLGNFKIKK